jgi:hypothetical protein
VVECTLTGTFSLGSQRQLRARLRSQGANPQKALRPTTDVVMVGRDPGAKLVRAQAQGVRVLHEADLAHMLGGGALEATLRASLEAQLTTGSAASWATLGHLVDGWPATSLPSVLGWLDAQLLSWPAALRRTPQRWLRRLVRGQEPRLRLCRVLSLRSQKVGPAKMARLAGSPDLGGIVSADLSRTRLAPSTLSSLRGAALARGLTELNLDGAQIGDQGVADLVALPELQGLETLAARFYSQISPLGAMALGGAGWSGMRVLLLGQNPVGDAGATSVVRGFPCLEVLDLWECGCGLSTAETLAARGAPSLRHLQLSSNPIGGQGLAALSASEGLGGLRELDLANCGIDDAGAEALARSPLATQLARLDLSHNQLSDRGARALLDSPLGRGAHLQLAHNRVSSALIKEAFVADSGKFDPFG